MNASGLLGDHGLYADQFANQYYTSGTEHLDQKRYSQAIEDLNEAIRLDPQHVNAYYNRGIAYRKRGLYEQAILDFDAYIRLDPDDASAYFKRAYAFDELDQHDR
ncbi:MAG: tetratricopeptide repeat protein, partial [SAR202 cluster bacterium]|nr:tetratricopeptide repeat protein [SAR202 cluster bacterium]